MKSSSILNPFSVHQIFLARVTFSKILLITNFTFLERNIMWPHGFLLNMLKAQEKDSNIILKQNTYLLRYDSFNAKKFQKFRKRI